MTFQQLKDWLNEEPGKRIAGCPLCEGTDKFCLLAIDEERGAVCERHGVVVPNNRHEDWALAWDEGFGRPDWEY